ncbi:MAG TPA: carboxypeptidase regulatory-like domain-containing protein, partial [Candidatus Angelobacter sp.]
ENINAPIGGPGGPVAFPGQGPIYQFQSAGIFKQEQLMTNVNVRAGAKLSLFGFFVINNAHSNTAGAASFPSNQFNLSQDYGRTPFDIRYRAFFGGSIALPRGFRVSPFMIFNSGQPFNITTGTDRNGDGIFNDRPFFANGSGGINTPFGDFAPPLTPAAPGEQIIPPYLGTGPNQFTLNMRLSKTFGFGQPREVAGDNPQNQNRGGGDRGRGGPGGPRGGPVFGGGPGGRDGIFGASPSNRPYNLTFSVSARNLFNNVNLATPIGIITSPHFDQSIALAGGPFSTSDSNRRVDLQVMFSF